MSKLSVPYWFKRSLYKDASKLDTRQWLMQIGLRMDIERATEELGSLSPISPSIKESIARLETLYTCVRRRPIAEVPQLVSEFGKSFEFPTVNAINEGHEAVRGMTLKDLYSIEQFVHPEKRAWCRKYFQEIETVVHFPDEELASSLAHPLADALPKYRRELIDKVMSPHQKRLSKHLSESPANTPPIYRRHPNKYVEDQWSIDDSATDLMPSVMYFRVDARIPYSIIEGSLRKLYYSNREKAWNSKKIDYAAMYAKWCDYGVLPYIDLKLYEALQRLTSMDRKLRISRDALRDNIYALQAGGKKRSASTVSDITKPIVKSLMDPEGENHLLLLIEKKRLDDAYNALLEECGGDYHEELFTYENSEDIDDEEFAYYTSDEQDELDVF